MKVIDPGHRFSLHSFDGGEAAELVFVKREGAGYPGNIGSHPGTNLQEVLRACIYRLAYLNSQIQDRRTREAETALRVAIEFLEDRAADRHGRVNPTRIGIDVVDGDFCLTCGHVGCLGDCRKAA